MKLRGDAHGAKTSFAESKKLKPSGSCHLFVDLVEITPLVFFDTQIFSRLQIIAQTFFFTFPVQMLIYVYELVLPSLLFSASQSMAGSFAAQVYFRI